MYQHILQQYNINPYGVIHIGASYGEEIEHYINLGVKNLIYIEANPESMETLTNHVGHFLNKISVQVHNYAICDSIGQKNFYVTDNKMSSSLLPLKTHNIHYPTIKHEKIIKVNGITFSEFIKIKNIDLKNYNVLVMDIQGTELSALKGAGSYLNNFELIVSEISREEVYEGCCLQPEIESYLKTFGFINIDYFAYPNMPNDDEYFIKEK